MVLVKEKNEELALYWLIRSVHLFPMNWGCWLEITSLISRLEDVGTPTEQSETVADSLLAKSDNASPADKYCLFHVPYPYFPGAVPARASDRPSSGPTLRHISQFLLPLDM